jgi:hypothetical protein
MAPNAVALCRHDFPMSMLGGPLSFAGDPQAAPRTMAAAARAIFDLADMIAPPLGVLRRSRIRLGIN